MQYFLRARIFGEDMRIKNQAMVKERSSHKNPDMKEKQILFRGSSSCVVLEA
jgi:hypothetical protein